MKILNANTCVRCQAGPGYVVLLRSKELLCLDCMLAAIEADELGVDDFDEDDEEAG